MKLLKLLALFVLPFTLMAQSTTTTSTTTEDSLMSKLENSKFDLMFISDSKTYKNNVETDEQGYLSENLVYFGYNLTENDNFRLDTSILTQNTDQSKTKNDWTGAGIRYARKNILTEENHGVNLSSEVRYQMYSPNDRSAAQKYGYISPRVNLNKRITENYGLNLNLRIYEYLEHSTASTDISERYFRVLFSQSYSLTKKITLGALFDYVNMKYGETAARNSRETVGFLASTSYAFTDKFSMDLYWDSTPFTSADDELFAQDWAETAAFGASLVYVLF